MAVKEARRMIQISRAVCAETNLAWQTVNGVVSDHHPENSSIEFPSETTGRFIRAPPFLTPLRAGLVSKVDR